MRNDGRSLACRSHAYIALVLHLSRTGASYPTWIISRQLLARNGATEFNTTSLITSEVQKLSSSPRNLSEWQAEDRPIFTFQGAKWKGTVGKVAKWVFRTCMVLMALFAVFYGATCLYSCCLGLDLLGKIWRTLGGCGALRALLSYFVNLEQATVVDDDADAAAPLIAAA
ncbi:hypothetical protein KC19_1G232000 [Ceratodon purpureus]|uniref:Uncharacterized protein n=1 Tax=Ceratodon purpureus TaxID=3225 RepID=A0A8T0J9K9_CERPU|nr:hypothetical protein KC19_1G232000 [Ceratodon purpureus]